MSKKSHPILESSYPTLIQRGMLGRSATNLSIDFSSTQKYGSGIKCPKPVYANINKNFKRPSSTNQFGSDNRDWDGEKIFQEGLADYKNLVSRSESKRRNISPIDTKPLFIDEECARQVCDELQNIVSTHRFPIPDTSRLQLDVCSSNYSDNVGDSMEDDYEFSGYSVTPPSRAANPIIANSAFREDKAELNGAELGLLSVSPPSLRLPSRTSFRHVSDF
jgi:hypothetical protein